MTAQAKVSAGCVKEIETLIAAASSETENGGSGSDKMGRLHNAPSSNSILFYLLRPLAGALQLEP